MNNYHYEWLNGFDKTRETLVCLHGFTGTLQTFAFLRNETSYNLLGIDLMGHGKTHSSNPDDYDMIQVVNDLSALKTKLVPDQKVAVVGYSMGARVALAWAITYPDMLSKLILESGSPGLKTDLERETRRIHDATLAERLRKKSLVEFVDFWQALPLFATQKSLPQDVQNTIRQERLAQDPNELANSLVYMGTGSQPEYWSHLETLSVPTLYLAGKQDPKFCEIGRKMCEQAPKMTYQEIDAGHCIHLERPVECQQAIKTFLESR
ncbi:2-succinyl-6-hydroxy-2,4-cyclohexadiene-1-carboxylate synthase [Enterococcus bulliens]